MKNICYNMLLLVFIAIAINACKADDPNIIPKTVPIPGYTDTSGDNGTGGDTTGTGGDTTGTGGDTTGTGGTDPGDGGYTDDGKDVPLGAVGTVVYKVDGSAAVTIKSVTGFSVIEGNNPALHGTYPNGITTVTGLDQSKNTTFLLSVEATKAGTYTISGVNLNTTTLNISNSKVGNIKITTLSYKTSNGGITGTIQGYFSGEEIDLSSDKTYFVKGSFNIKQ